MTFHSLINCELRRDRRTDKR